MPTTFYPSDLTDAQWALLDPMLPQTNPLGRPPSPVRPIFNGILYVLRGGHPLALSAQGIRAVANRLWQVSPLETGGRLEIPQRPPAHGSTQSPGQTRAAHGVYSR